MHAKEESMANAVLLPTAQAVMLASAALLLYVYCVIGN
jgi:hypothetical protein